jgi:uncharacterized protein YbjQ (UPF0145 family)
MEQKYKIKTVFAVSVKTRHFLSDWFQGIKNAVGMNLTSYEKVLEESIEEALFKLYKQFPDVYDVHVNFANMVYGATQVIVYGKVKDVIK